MLQGSQKIAASNHLPLSQAVEKLDDPRPMVTPLEAPWGNALALLALPYAGRIAMLLGMKPVEVDAEDDAKLELLIDPEANNNPLYPLQCSCCKIHTRGSTEPEQIGLEEYRAWLNRYAELKEKLGMFRIDDNPEAIDLRRKATEWYERWELTRSAWEESLKQPFIEALKAALQLASASKLMVGRGESWSEIYGDMGIEVVRGDIRHMGINLLKDFPTDEQDGVARTFLSQLRVHTNTGYSSAYYWDTLNIFAPALMRNEEY